MARFPPIGIALFQSHMPQISGSVAFLRWLTNRPSLRARHSTQRNGALSRSFQERVRLVSNLGWLAVPIATGVVAVAFAVYLIRWVLAQDAGNKEMQRVAGYIFAGAQAFLRRQYQTIAILAVVAAIVIGFILALVTQLQTHTFDLTLAAKTAGAFLFGAFCSGLAGFIGMQVAVRSNSRVASAAQQSLGQALTVALRGGAVTGFLVIALSLLGVTIIFLIFGGLNNPAGTTTSIVGFGFGASFVALFAQLGGGIYTKAADVGADLVGKVEEGIPEDDPRNPAVIADLVGDNVGDCAGRGADLFESTAAENIGAMILGAAVATSFTGAQNGGWILFPLVAVGFGIIASLIGVLTVRASAVHQVPGKDPGAIAMNQLNLGFYVTAVLSAIAIVGTTYILLHQSTSNWWYFALAGLIGILNTFAFVYITQYYTSGAWRPVRDIANSALTGPATTVITGLAIGFENTGLPVLAIAISLGASYALGNAAGVPGSHGLISTGGIYATAVATVGMLMSVGYILAMDSFGPITDNAGGIVEMSEAPESVRTVTDALDSVGNTTKALTKGYGIGSASLAAFLLISAYLDIVAPSNYDVNMANPPVFIAGLIGAMLIFVFSSLAMRAVGRAAQGMINEVRRQFREDPGIMQGTSLPDYGKCVDISMQSALRQMVLPGLLVVITPILVGVFLGPEAAAGMLIVGTIAGIMMALVMNNGGGAWDNAKKYIEAGRLVVNGQVQKKGSPAHAAAVVGDTIGDPFKDTAGPSLHVVIKLLSTITLVLAPLYVYIFAQFHK
jgi:K(+)-stimulated pyrophosphate-energized sodium pump